MKNFIYFTVIIIAALSGHDAFGMRALETKQKEIAKEPPAPAKRNPIPAPASEDREEDFVKDAKNYALLQAYIRKENESVQSDKKKVPNDNVRTYRLRYMLAPLWQDFYLVFKKKYGTDWDAKKIEAIYLREKGKMYGDSSKSGYFDS